MGPSPAPCEPRDRPIRSFVLRRGHISTAQQRAYEALLPQVGLPYQNAPLKLTHAFARNAPTILEIGFGMGEATAAMAAARPDINFLCLEVFAAGIGALCKRIAQTSLTNIRIIEHDAVEVVHNMLEANSLAGIHIFFPDPWPKKRHHKRRLIAPAFVHTLASRLAPGAYLHCATDWEHYAQQMLSTLSQEPLLTNAHPDYAPAPSNPLLTRPTTKFHARGQRLGHGAWDLVFIRSQT